MNLNSREIKFKFIEINKCKNPEKFIQNNIDKFYKTWHTNSTIKHYLNLVKKNNSFYNIKISLYYSNILNSPQGISIYAEGNLKYDKLFGL